MGYFRRHKVRDQTLDEVKAQCVLAKDKVIEAAKKDEEIEELITDWACWRELQARLENDNKGRES